MALVENQPDDLPTTNALDEIPGLQLNNPPAYLRFGSSPTIMPEPPRQGEKRTYMVRVYCTGEHGPIERKDDVRYTRDLQILWIADKGAPEPPDPDQEAPSLFSVFDNNEGNTAE